MAESFFSRLRSAWNKKNSLLCVGLDPIKERIPKKYFTGQSAYSPYFNFFKDIVDATAEFAICYKPQIAHFSAIRAEKELEEIIGYIRQAAPMSQVILDSKRGDIGTTANFYAKEAFERYKADAVTLNPYLGFDSISPFLEYKDKGVFILCRTSNPSAIDFQNVIDTNSGDTLYQKVAKKSLEWNKNSNSVGLVVGATYPDEMKQIRDIVGDEIPFLVPGIGAQGGDLNTVLEKGTVKKEGYFPGLIISSSRGIIYSENPKESAEDLAKLTSS